MTYILRPRRLLLVHGPLAAFLRAQAGELNRFTDVKAVGGEGHVRASWLYATST